MTMMPDVKAKRKREEERTNITNKLIKKMMKKPTRLVVNQMNN
jgi:hypothetical protein